MAMLKDILRSFQTNDDVDKIWFFSPQDHYDEAVDILTSIGCLEHWTLEPNQLERGVNQNLGEVLSKLYRKYCGMGYRSVTFIGGDTPYLSCDELLRGIASAIHTRKEPYICPAFDGGYVLMTLPACLACDDQLSVDSKSAEIATPDVSFGLGNTKPNTAAPPTNESGCICISNCCTDPPLRVLPIFQNIRWSTEYTLRDQISRLQEVILRKMSAGLVKDQDQNQDQVQSFLCAPSVDGDKSYVRVGGTYCDIDEEQDLLQLLETHKAAKAAAISATEPDSAGIKASRAVLAGKSDNISDSSSESPPHWVPISQQTIDVYQLQCRHTMSVLESIWCSGKLS